MDWVAYARDHYPYWVSIALMLTGVYTMAAQGNLLKKVIGMNVFQTAVILFFITASAKRGATLPVVAAGTGPLRPEAFVNPLPHALMLTAIVVMVATLGVALAVLVRIHRAYGSFEEDAILGRR